jgi:hypothetical protein
VGSRDAVVVEVAHQEEEATAILDDGIKLAEAESE